MFQGGALEFSILEITEIDPDRWQRLRSALVRTGLLQIEVLENLRSPFLKFHPTLSPVLFMRLSAEKYAKLNEQYQEYYYDLSIDLYKRDFQSPHTARLFAKRELPNLLWSVKEALANQCDNVADFVNNINKFLHVFGLQRDQQFLIECLNQITVKSGSRDWYLILSSKGEQLFESGKYDRAEVVFRQILWELGSEISFNRANTLVRLGRCLRFQGNFPMAEKFVREGISVSEQLVQNEYVQRQQSEILSDLGDILAELGKFEQAKNAYENSLVIAEKNGYLRVKAVAKGQIGILFMRQDDLEMAFDSSQEALDIFHELQESDSQAGILHQLGIIYRKRQNWEEADRAYRKAARIWEKQGNSSKAASTYGELANLNLQIDKLIEAEGWYRKALQAAQLNGDKLVEHNILIGLASLLVNQPNRLIEAQEFTRAALEICKILALSGILITL